MKFTGTIQITLISFKNINIWLSYGPNKTRKPILLFGHTFLGHNPAIFGPIGLNIIYRLMMRNPRCDAYFPFLIFGHFCWENGRGHNAHSWWTAGLHSLQTRTKRCPQSGPFHFLANHYLEIMFLKYLGVNPLPLLDGYIKY